DIFPIFWDDFCYGLVYFSLGFCLCSCCVLLSFSPLYSCPLLFFDFGLFSDFLLFIGCIFISIFIFAYSWCTYLVFFYVFIYLFIYLFVRFYLFGFICLVLFLLFLLLFWCLWMFSISRRVFLILQSLVLFIFSF